MIRILTFRFHVRSLTANYHAFYCLAPGRKSVGYTGGIWQSRSFVSTNPEQIGEKLDLATEQAVNRLQGKEEAIRRDGILSADVVPKVEVIGGTEFDFGTMKRGTRRSHKFVFKNSGSADLKLEVAGSTCKCTVGSVKEGYIKPGEETPVELTWTAEGIQPDFAQTATISTNDPRMKEVKLTLTGRIGMNYVIAPEELDLGEFSSRDTVVRKFRVYALEETPLKCSGYWGDDDLWDLIKVENTIQAVEKGSIPEYADARWVADFTVTVNPGMTAGPINGQIRLMIGPDDYPMSVPTTGKCVSDLRILASRGYDEEKNLLDLGLLTAKREVNRTASISR